MRQLKFKIAGKKWVLRLLHAKKYRKKNGKDSLAVTYIHKRRIDASPRGIDRETFIHELVHAYLSEFCIHSCTLDAENLEEFFCELLSKRGEEIIALADKLLKNAKLTPSIYPVAQRVTTK